MNKKSTESAVRIAPKIGRCGSWTDEEWASAKKNNNWEQMIQIFSDRINGRYLVFIKEMKDKPYSGFAVMSIGCALIETLHQFYKGFESSNHAKWDCGHRMSNTEFYVQFLTESSYIFKNHFKDKKQAKLFYDHFRCGLIHQAETKSDSKIRRKKGQTLFEPTKNGLIVYRETFVDLLEQEITEYISQLKADTIPDIRKHFVKKMDYICRVEFEELAD